MPSARYDLSIGAGRAGALFASPLQRSDEPAVRSASLKPSGTGSPSSQQPDPPRKYRTVVPAMVGCPRIVGSINLLGSRTLRSTVCSSARTVYGLVIAWEPNWGAIRRRAAGSLGESGRSFALGKSTSRTF
jgi:hypothetical protein